MADVNDMQEYGLTNYGPWRTGILSFSSQKELQEGMILKAKTEDGSGWIVFRLGLDVGGYKGTLFFDGDLSKKSPESIPDENEVLVTRYYDQQA